MTAFNRPLCYLLDEQGNPYSTDDTLAAGTLIADTNKRRVALTEKDVAGHTIYLSTVFLVFDHGHSWQDEPYQPILYETMLFIDDTVIDNATQRYHTKEEARTGHEEVLAGVEYILMQLGQNTLDTTQIIALLTEGAQP